MGPRIYPSEQSTNAAANGTLILSFDDTVFPGGNLNVSINSVARPSIFRNTSGFDYHNLLQNDVVTISTNLGSAYRKVISVYRRDYTTDDQGGNNGIVDTLITGFTTTGNSYTFTATTIPSAYNFEYRLSLTVQTGPTPTPTSTPTPIPTPTPTPLISGVTFEWVYNWTGVTGNVVLQDYSQILSSIKTIPFISGYTLPTNTGTISGSSITYDGSIIRSYNSFNVITNVDICKTSGTAGITTPRTWAWYQNGGIQAVNSAGGNLSIQTCPSVTNQSWQNPTSGTIYINDGQTLRYVVNNVFS